MADETAGDPAPRVAVKKAAPTNTNADVQVSAMVPRSLKESLEARARDEDRTLGVVIRRALLAYQRDWKAEDPD